MSWHSALVSSSALSSTTITGSDIRRDRRDQPNHVGDADCPSRDRSEHLRLDALHPVERDCEVGEEHGRVVVSIVDRHPSHPARLQTRELRQQRRLAIPGWRHHGDQWDRIGSRQRIEERTPGHDPRARPVAPTAWTHRGRSRPETSRRACALGGAARRARASLHEPTSPSGSPGLDEGKATPESNNRSGRARERSLPHHGRRQLRGRRVLPSATSEMGSITSRQRSSRRAVTALPMDRHRPHQIRAGEVTCSARR